MLGRLRTAREPDRADTGKWGEAQAARFLKRTGYRILGTRVRVKPRGELDLVARDGQILVFVEVKTRHSEDFGRPISAVDRNKRRALCRAAVRYLERLRYPRICFRFDVVEVVGGPGEPDPVVRHVQNAFQLDRRYQLPI